MRCLPLPLVLLFGTPYLTRAQCHFPKTSTLRTITYRFRPEIAQDGLVLHVSLEFQARTVGMEMLALPTRWAGETLHSMTNLRTVSRGASLSDGPDDHTKILRAPKKRLVVIAYDLKKDWVGPLVNPMQFHPVLTPKYFQFTGSNALVRLELDKGASETANFDWEEIPASWALATSFGTSKSLADRCQTYSGPWIDVVHGRYTAGDYRIHRFEIAGQPAVLAVRGTWTFSDADAISQIQKTVGMVHDHNFPYFLVTLKPYDRDHGSSDGSPFTNAFWIYVSRLDSFSALLGQLAHEAFHEWNPGRMGFNEDSRATDWFWEGFTQYYGESLVYRAGEMATANYVDSLNRDLRQFPTSDDPDLRGPVIALWLDGAIRRESNGEHSLDDLMLEMVRSRNQSLTLTRIFQTAGRYLSAESLKLLHNAVIDHASLPAPDQIPSVGNCAHPTQEDLPTFKLGLDKARSLATGKVVGVVEGGPAFVAGLREGQLIGGRVSVTNGNPDVLAIITIHTDGATK